MSITKRELLDLLSNPKISDTAEVYFRAEVPDEDGDYVTKRFSISGGFVPRDGKRKLILTEE